MGERRISAKPKNAGSRTFIRALLDDLRALEEILSSGMIESSVRRIGAEQELFLIGEGGHPALIAMEVLEKLNDPHFTTELGLFNLEINLDPLVLEGDALRCLETNLLDNIGKAREAANSCGAEVALVGILPTLRKSDLGLESMTPLPRYQALNRLTSEMRNGPYDFRIMGVDELSVTHDSVMLEACNCSFQMHFQVSADEFVDLYNIAQVVSAPVLAAAVNSPMLFGRRLWQETRIPLFQQSIDTRHSSDYLRERSPRVTFGKHWVRESVLELFREDIARFRAFIGPEMQEGPFEKLKEGEAPDLAALCLHNGTVYRWNRPCYGLTKGKPHLRIENRILPSGPSIRDEVANAAFWFGLIGGLERTVKNIPDVFEFECAKSNFLQAARSGLAAQFEWVNGHTVPAKELILEQLLPLAREALLDKKLSTDDVDLYLGVIEERVRGGQTGARWIVRSFTKMVETRSHGERLEALTAAMVTRQKDGEPVSKWELASIEESKGWKHSFRHVEQIMTTDVFSVQEDEPVELVAQLMDWQLIRHIPVEDHANRLVGLISYRAIIRALVNRTDPTDEPIPVSSIMKRDVVTVAPRSLTLDALRLMRQHRIGCAPVLKDGCLVGILTERDFMDVAGQLLVEQLADDSQAEDNTCVEDKD